MKNVLFFTAFFDVGSIACVIEPKKNVGFSENSCGLSTESGALFRLSSLLFLCRRGMSDSPWSGLSKFRLCDGLSWSSKTKTAQTNVLSEPSLQSARLVCFLSPRSLRCEMSGFRTTMGTTGRRCAQGKNQMGWDQKSVKSPKAEVASSVDSVSPQMGLA